MRRENDIQRVRVKRKITYAKAVRVSRQKDDTNSGRVAVRAQGLQQIPDERIYVDKRALVTFIAGVINSTAEATSKNDQIHLVVKAAVKHLGLVGHGKK